MTRVALYARYSSDSQRDASIEDQLRLCSEYAQKQGWTVVDTYFDRAVSGDSLLRDGILEVMQDALKHGFDVVLAEALDRISRDQEDLAAVFKRLRFASVKLVTVAEGDISELHIGLKGTMNALFLKDLAAKTHRGIRGRVEAGKNAGGNCFGYRVVKMSNTSGEPIRGEREIVETEATVIRRVFREFAAGRSPRRIALDLNRAGIPGPDGGLWARKIVTASREAVAQALNATHRPRTLLSGLLVCGCCGGSFARRGQDRYACMTHIRTGRCHNSRTIARKALETRVLDGLRNKLMEPEVAAEAMRAYAVETNRLNRERRTAGDADRRALADIERKLREIVSAIEDGGYSRMLSDRLRELEAKHDKITERMARSPVDLPDIHPNVADIYRRKVARLADALNHPEDRHEAADALRGLIERIVLKPGPKPRQPDVTLYGELGTIVEWVVRVGKVGLKNTTITSVACVSASVNARA